MKKGFTIVEILVVLVILAAFFGIICGAVSAYHNNDETTYDNAVDYLNPEYSRAMSERRQAQALEEQNQLKREELELRRKELENK